MPKINRKSFQLPIRVKLIAAITSNNIKKIKILLNQGADPNQIIDFNGDRLLHHAARNGYLEVVMLLLQHGAKESINQQNKFGHTPLHEIVMTKNEAINANQEAIANLLLQQGANMFLENNSQQSSLKLAIDNHHPIKRLFLEKIRALRAAAPKNNIATVNFLLGTKIDPNQEDNTTGCRLLHVAARYGWLETAKSLLQNDTKKSINQKDEYGHTPLHKIVMIKNKDINANYEAIVNLLLQQGANIFLEDNSQQSSLELAILNNHVPIQRLFLEKIRALGTDILKSEMLQTVLKNGVATMNFLLSAKIDPNQEDNTTGCILLHLAAQHGFLEIAKLLLDHGADVNKANKIGFTALHYAADNNHLAIIQLLLKYGASKFIQDNYHRIPGQLIRDKELTLLPRQNFFHNLPREFEDKNKTISEDNNIEPLDLSMKGPSSLSY